MDVMGVAFRRDLFLVIRQVYPELQDKEKLTHTKIQQKLLRKLGNNAYPFFFEVRLGDRNEVIMHLLAGPDLSRSNGPACISRATSTFSTFCRIQRCSQD